MCFEYKVVPVEYFMDKMQEYELATIIENIPYMDVAAWEQTRDLMFIYAQSLSKKQLKHTDILHFAWDDIEPKDTEITNSDINRLRAQAKNIEEQLKK